MKNRSSDEWFERQDERQINIPPKPTERLMPMMNTSYLSNLIGAYPMPGQDDDSIQNRLKNILKSLREEKTNQTGTHPNIEI